MEKKQVDLLLRDPANNIVTLEVAGQSGEHEVHNALFCARCDEVRKHVVVCINKKILNEVRTKFAGFVELSNDPRIELVLLSKALSEDWMP